MSSESCSALRKEPKWLANRLQCSLKKDVVVKRQDKIAWLQATGELQVQIVRLQRIIDVIL